MVSQLDKIKENINKIKSEVRLNSFFIFLQSNLKNHYFQTKLKENNNQIKSVLKGIDSGYYNGIDSHILGNNQEKGRNYRSDIYESDNDFDDKNNLENNILGSEEKFNKQSKDGFCKQSQNFNDDNDQVENVFHKNYINDINSTAQLNKDYDSKIKLGADSFENNFNYGPGSTSPGFGGYDNKAKSQIKSLETLDEYGNSKFNNNNYDTYNNLSTNVNAMSHLKCDSNLNLNQSNKSYNSNYNKSNNFSNTKLETSIKPNNNNISSSNRYNETENKDSIRMKSSKLKKQDLVESDLLRKPKITGKKKNNNRVKNDYNSEQTAKLKVENFDLRNRIHIIELEKERLRKDFLKKKEQEKYIVKELKKKLPQKSKFTYDEEKELEQYEEEKIEEIDKYNMYPLYQQKDEIGDYVDKLIVNSYQYYMNRPCFKCAKLLSKGGNTAMCLNHHHSVKKTFL